MMAGFARNAPCPCNSGKKYKQCCLRKEVERERDSRQGDRAVVLAFAWLDERYEEEMTRLLKEQFFRAWADKELPQVPAELLEVMYINGREYVLCEGRIRSEDSRIPVPALDLVLGPGGPLLAAGQRQHLENLRKAPLSLYEVVAVQRGRGMELQDLLDESIPPQHVVDRKGSAFLEVGGLLGARLIPGHPWKLSGAIYGFPTGRAPMILRDVRKALADSPPDLDHRRLKGSLIIDVWISLVIA